MKVTYPKFKLGDEVVREIAVPPTYGKYDVKCLEFKHILAELHAEGARSTMGKINWEMHESQKFWLGYDVTSVRPYVRTSAPPCKPM